MGFWKNLASWGVRVSPYVAAPFTGGATLHPGVIGAANAGATAIDGGDIKDIALSGGIGAATAGVGGVGGAGANAANAAGSQGTQGFWGQLANTMTRPEVLKASSGALANYANSAANNRMTNIGLEGSDISKMQMLDSVMGSKDYEAPISYGFGPKSASEQTKKAAEKTQGDVIKRIGKRRTTPSVWEQIAGFAAPAVAITGAARENQDDPNDPFGIFKNK